MLVKSKFVAENHIISVKLIIYLFTGTKRLACRLE